MKIQNKIILGTTALFLAFSGADADTSSTSEIRNVKEYGNCTVLDQVDMFTDDVSHHIVCKESTWTDETSLSVNLWSGNRYDIRLSKGVQFHLEDSIAVAYRFDKGNLYQATVEWFSENNVAAIRDRNRSVAILNDLAKADRVVIRVGDEGGNITLKGSARAVDDFRERAGLKQVVSQPEKDRD